MNKFVPNPRLEPVRLAFKALKTAEAEEREALRVWQAARLKCIELSRAFPSVEMLP